MKNDTRAPFGNIEKHCRVFGYTLLVYSNVYVLYTVLYMYKINIDIFLFLFRLSKDKVCSNNDDNEVPSPSIMVQMLWGLSLLCEAVRLKTVFKCRLFNLCTGGGADRSGRLFFQRQRPHKLHHSTLIR